MTRARYWKYGKRNHSHRLTGRTQGPLQPWLLLLLLQEPGHGYNLMERLSKSSEIPDADPSLLYRTLRQLEEDGMVHSSWDTEGQGPARRLYRVTPAGIEYLHNWAYDIRLLQSRLAHFLSEYEAYFKNEEKH